MSNLTKSSKKMLTMPSVMFVGIAALTACADISLNVEKDGGAIVVKGAKDQNTVRGAKSNEKIAQPPETVKIISSYGLHIVRQNPCYVLVCGAGGCVLKKISEENCP